MAAVPSRVLGSHHLGFGLLVAQVGCAPSTCPGAQEAPTPQGACGLRTHVVVGAIDYKTRTLISGWKPEPREGRPSTQATGQLNQGAGVWTLGLGLGHCGLSTPHPCSFRKST